LSIYNTIHENTPKQRKAIGRHLRKAILPLIKAEEKAEAEAGAREARVLKTKELEAETEATKVILYHIMHSSFGP
jgi:hypothetical protein